MSNAVIFELLEAPKARSIIERLGDRVSSTPQRFQPLVRFLKSFLFVPPHHILRWNRGSANSECAAQIIPAVTPILLLWTICIILFVWTIVYMTTGGRRYQIHKKIRRMFKILNMGKGDKEA
jgi:hypothetical protein